MAQSKRTTLVSEGVIVVDIVTGMGWFGNEDRGDAVKTQNAPPPTPPQGGALQISRMRPPSQSYGGRIPERQSLRVNPRLCFGWQ
jgi:hypothetical protein